MSKSEFQSTTNIITYETTVPAETVIARLEEEVNKAGSEGIMKRLREITYQEELEELVNSVVKNDFLYFTEFPHHELLKKKLVQGGEEVQKRAMIVYTIGNPLIAQGLLEYHTMSAYCIPPRLLILEKADGNGCTAIYYQPSTVMGVPVEDKDPTVERELEELDRKLENLVAKITAE